ncbi:MAG TPA: hypothetical protein DCM87_05825 [Planctomycetes bacterium]|nr:hypothetical protein [Planctomycetota bacterium]
MPRASALIALLSIGCASISLHELVQPPARERQVREENAGLAVVCRLVAAREEAEFFFGADLIGMGILPVIVRIENTSGDAFALSAAGARVTLEDGSTLVHLPWSAAAEAVSFSYWRAVPGFLFAVIPGLVIADSVSMTNERIAGHYRRMAIEEAALPPGAGALGVLFFIPPDGGKLRIEAAARGADVRLPFVRRAEPDAAPCEIVVRL